MASKKQDQANAIYELFDIARQHRWRFAVPAFVMMAAVLVGALFLPRKYRATAHFEQRNDPVLTEMTNSGATRSYMDPASALYKEIASQPAIGRAVKDLEPDLRKRGYIQSDMDVVQLRQTVQQLLLVSNEYNDDTRVRVRLELVLDDPDVSAMIINQLVDSYMKRTRAQMLGRLEEMSNTFRSEAQAQATRVEDLENAMLSFEIEHADLLPDHPFSVQTQLNKAQEDLADLETKLETAEKRIMSLRGAIAQEPVTVPMVVHGANPQVVRLQTKLEEIEDDIAHHLTVLRMRPQHPDVQALESQAQTVRGQIAALDEQVVTSTQQQPNPKRADLEMQLTVVTSDRDALREQVSMRESRIQTLTAATNEMLPVRTEYRRIEAELAKAERDIQYWEDRLRRAEMSQTAETGERGVQMDFIRRADANPLPISPNLAQVVLTALFLGMACGTASVFLAHRSDGSYRNAKQLTDNTNLPLLGAVSELITRRRRRVRMMRYYVFYPLNTAVMASVLILIGGLLYIDLQKPHVMDELKERARGWVMQLEPDASTASLLPGEEPVN
ncbi:MAG: hypothetical protein AAGC44_09525 [Planctomycetota bacterium]